MTPTRDVEKFRLITQGNEDMERRALELADAGRLVALASDGGAMVFIRTDKDAEWKVSLAFNPDARGEAAKTDINDGFAWMFINTDAVNIIGTIAAENKACLAMVPHTLGYELEDQGAAKVYRARLDRWASDYGLKGAIEAMEAAGNGKKVDVLAKLGVRS